MELKLSEIINAVNATVIKQPERDKSYGFSTDTRNIKKGEIYIPLKGENFDGENFIENAINANASGYITSDKTKIYEKAEVILLVDDTKKAYLEIAAYYKNKINPLTIAVTGSSGKTTVKEMLYSVFKNAGKTTKSVLNHNNEIGLCQTLCSQEQDNKYLIVEMGMRGTGEIELLSKYSEPDIAIIVNSGSAHIGRLGSLLNIAKAKFEITKYLKKHGILISHDNPLIKGINDIRERTIYFGINSDELKIISISQNESIFEYKGNEYKLNVGGEHNIENALSVIEAGLCAKLSPEMIKKGLAEFSPIEKRWDCEQIQGFNIINDCYNSNPESVKAAIKTFLSYYPSPKVLVLGDMGELGESAKEYHIATGKFIDNFECDYILTLGEIAKYIQSEKIKTIHFENKKDIVDFIKNELPKNSNILLKASRFMKFEDIIEELKK